MPNLKLVLLSWNGQFPSAFGRLTVGELQFGYAIFQLLRNNALFHLLLFFLPTLLLRLLYLHRRRVVLLSEKPDGLSYDDVPISTGKHLSKLRLDAKKVSEHWFNVSYGDHHYLCFKDNLLPLAELCQKYKDCTDRFSFADSVVEVMGMVKVAKLISTPEAIDKVLRGGYELCEADTYTFYYCLDWLKVDSKWIPVLSCVPIYLQAIGANNLSGAFSCLVILLDFFKNLLWRMYDKLFTKLTVFAKLRIFGKRTWLYNLLGVFSDRWKYCDPIKKHAYVLERGTLICVGRVCRFKGKLDFDILAADPSTKLGPAVEIRDGEVVQWSEDFSYQGRTQRGESGFQVLDGRPFQSSVAHDVPHTREGEVEQCGDIRDDQCYFDIIDGKAHIRPRVGGNFYLYGKLGCAVFV